MNHGIQLPTKESARLAPEVAKKWMGILGGLGALGLAGAAAGFFADHAQFLHSYTAAYMWALSLTLGALFFTVLQHLVGAHWSVVVRRIAESIMAVMPAFAVLLLPILTGIFGHHEPNVPSLYHWADHEAVLHDEVLAAKSGYLNPTFFMIRIVIYFAIWIGVAMYFYKRSVASDESGDVSLVQQMRRMSAPSILLYALSQTFASFDLLMSIEPHWFSTIFGVYFFAGSIVNAFALIALIALLLRRGGMLVNVITLEHYHDLGKLMFAFSVFWTYIAFCQYFLIWYGNIPEETVYFLHRWEGSWKSVSLLLLVGKFLVPFWVLMSRHVKKTLPVLLGMAVWMVFMQYVDMYWMVLPNLHKDGVSIHWMDISCMVGMLGLGGAMIVRNLGRASLVPLQDPLLEKSVGFENA